jgi:hypothetical protein
MRYFHTSIDGRKSSFFTLFTGVFPSLMDTTVLHGPSHLTSFTVRSAGVYRLSTCGTLSHRFTSPTDIGDNVPMEKHLYVLPFLTFLTHSRCTHYIWVAYVYAISYGVRKKNDITWLNLLKIVENKNGRSTVSFWMSKKIFPTE